MELAAEERKLVSTLQSSDGDAATVKLGLETSSAAFDQLLRGEATLALTTRQITDEEASAFIEAGLGDPRLSGRETVVALDALVMATSAENPLTSLTLQEAVGVIAGRVTNWSELGGPDSPIELLLPSTTSEAYQVFSEEIMRPLRLRPSTSPTATLEKTDLAQQLSGRPAAIGLTTLSGIGSARPIPLRLACGLVAQPNQFSVKAEDYPLTRRVYLYSRTPNPEGISGALYEFATSSEGRALFAALGYIDQSTTSLPVEEQGVRFLSAIMAQSGAANIETLQTMASEILSAERLSTTFRFDSTGEALDSRGELDVERLADLLRDRSANSEVILLGFTDDVGRSDINQLVAKDRADLVRAQLLSALGDSLPSDSIKSIGLGSTAPVACNTDVSGRQANRRVEVWIKG
ncbi:MAG: phosphate ABC transporter substrate-binding/OmpA family protein [Pseudomonadota bacterium]